MLKDILLLCTYQLFSGSNAWDFRLVMTAISENASATSKDFWWFSEDFWMLPKVSKEVPLSFEHFQSYLKDNNVSVFFYLIRTRLHHSRPVWNILVENELNFCHKSCVKEQYSSGFVSQVWEMVLDVWDRRLKAKEVRLTHNAWLLAGVLLLFPKTIFPNVQFYAEKLEKTDKRDFSVAGM